MASTAGALVNVSHLLLRQSEMGRGPVLVTFSARGKHLFGQAMRLQLAQRVVHRAGFQRHQRLARGLLVGGPQRRRDRQRIHIRRGGFLLDQATQHARLGGGQYQR